MADRRRITRSMIQIVDTCSDVNITINGKKRKLSDTVQTVSKRRKFKSNEKEDNNKEKREKSNGACKARSRGPIPRKTTLTKHDNKKKRQCTTSETSQKLKFQTRSSPRTTPPSQENVKTPKSTQSVPSKGRSGEGRRKNSAKHANVKKDQSLKSHVMPKRIRRGQIASTKIARNTSKQPGSKAKSSSIQTKHTPQTSSNGSKSSKSKDKIKRMTGTNATSVPRFMRKRSRSNARTPSTVTTSKDSFPNPEKSFILERKETFKIGENKKKRYSSNTVWSMCVLASGDILVTDTSIKWLKLVDGKSHKIIDKLALASMAHSICMVNETDAVVALSNQKIQFVSTLEKLVVTRTVKLNHMCLGVCVLSENLYITDGSGRNIYVYDLEGNFISRLGGEEIFSWNRFMAVSDDLCSFYVTDRKLGVFKMAPNGEVIWNLTPPILSGAFGVCTDGCGNVIASGYESENVALISSTGSMLKEIVPSTDCPRKTAAVCFDRMRAKLYVSGYNNDVIHVYYFK